MDFGSIILPWTTHVRSGRDLVRRAFEVANRIGDLTYATYACDMMITNLLAAGDPLVEVQREAERGLAFTQKASFGLIADVIATQLGLVRTLGGLTATFGSFDDEQFSEARIERRSTGNPNLALLEWWYWVRKLQARFLAGDYTAALEALTRAQPCSGRRRLPMPVRALGRWIVGFSRQGSGYGDAYDADGRSVTLGFAPGSATSDWLDSAVAMNAPAAAWPKSTLTV
jgi:hypothetical protein